MQMYHILSPAMLGLTQEPPDFVKMYISLFTLQIFEKYATWLLDGDLRHLSITLFSLKKKTQD